MDNSIELSFVGPLHNRILQELTQLSNFPDFSLQEVYETGKTVIESYYQEKEFGDPEVPSFDDFNSKVDNVLNEGGNMKSLFNSFKDEGKINEEQLNFLLNINSLCQDSKNSNLLADNLFQIERDVSKSSSLDFNQIALVYGTSVIGRNSVSYWYSAYNNQNDPWQAAVAPGDDPKWWERGLRDAAGFTAGFLLGSALSGGNPAVGAAAGTAVAAGCSAA